MRWRRPPRSVRPESRRARRCATKRETILRQCIEFEEVATIAEQGVEGVVAVGWIGLSAPARTPEPILDRLSGEVMKILNEPEVLEKLKSLAFVPAKESRQEFEAYIAIENTKWRKIVQDAGVKIE